MNTSKVIHQAKLNDWANTIREQQASSLNVTEWCQSIFSITPFITKKFNTIVNGVINIFAIIPENFTTSGHVILATIMPSTKPKTLDANDISKN
ncbi:hypothetical protein [Pseudobutyrivibrio ruminis]|uniref:hypothetical protein n=1 Tax=Pseudobutyrivibrio ruminis TaxID=46206 RepID=UPI0018C9A5E7|nr:hypothetical protein [Pseudobutyrivibrio ruminis]